MLGNTPIPKTLATKVNKKQIFLYCGATNMSHFVDPVANINDMSSSEKNSKPEPDRQYEAKERKCLRCREEFMSSWPGERICRTCKSSSAWREGIAA